MKKAILLALAAMCVSALAFAQEPEAQPEKEKKKGGFMKALKKGVESTTGLRVSDEALFVYPTIGEWKMSVVSCIGDPQTGAVQLVVKYTRLTGDANKSVWSNLREAKVTGGDALTIDRRAADPLYTFEANKPVDVVYQMILGVPADTKTIDVKFNIGTFDEMFEARRIPVEWLGSAPKEEQPAE